MSTKALERHLEPLKPYLNQDGVTEICINQPKEIFVERNRQFTAYIIEALEFGFLEALAALIAEFNHKDFSVPLLSGTLPTGERIQCALPPACERNKIIFSIRRHQMQDLTLDDYVKQKIFDIQEQNADKKVAGDTALIKHNKNHDMVNFLKTAIENRKNIIICGGTGTGKTTFLNACLKLIPADERLITVEDTREVVVKQPNHVNLLFNEDNEQITALKLFKVCLRLRPDRIFLSELRGAEAWPFLRAANSGHPGSLSTVHADTPQGCFDQLVFMMQQAGSTSSDERLRQYIQSIIHIVIQLKKCPSKERLMAVSDIYFDALHP